MGSRVGRTPPDGYDGREMIMAMTRGNRHADAQMPEMLPADGRGVHRRYAQATADASPVVEGARRNTRSGRASRSGARNGARSPRSAAPSAASLSPTPNRKRNEGKALRGTVERFSRRRKASRDTAHQAHNATGERVAAAPSRSPHSGLARHRGPGLAHLVRAMTAWRG